MSYDTEKVRLGRDPLTFIGLEMDSCSLLSGIGACTATETGDDKCYNTRSTCNDPDNFAKTTKSYQCSQSRSNLPRGVSLFPVIIGDIKKTPSSVTGGAGMGNKAVIKIKLKDFPHHDRGIDPYVSERTYNAQDNGTFWGKFLKRNPYYEGRTLKVYYGYIGNTWDLADFEVQEYDIIDIDGPTNGMVTITAKDVLVRMIERKAQYPVLSDGSLLADITDVATTATLTPTGIGNSDYAASGTVTIGKEAIAFTRAADVLTLTRAQWGTDAKEHKAGDTVQISPTWSSVNIIDFLYELQVTGANIPAAYIDFAAWEAERDLWLSGANVTGILMKPESVEKVVSEVLRDFMLDMWWDAANQLINIKALSPEPSGTVINTLSESNNIIKDSLKIERKSKDRITRVTVWFDKIDYSQDDKPENFRTGQSSISATNEDANHYDEKSIKTITSRWFTAAGHAAAYSGRTLARFSVTPETVTFMLDNKDHGKLSIAGRIELDSWQFQSVSGANEARKFQVLEVSEADSGHDFKVTCLTSSFTGRYAFIAPDGTPDYLSATEEQKNKYCWICQNDGLFSDGSDGYKII